MYTRPVKVRHVKHFPRAGERSTPIRHYSSFKAAAAGAVRWAITHGKVKEKFEIYHETSGLSLGTVQVQLDGQLKVTYIGDRA